MLTGIDYTMIKFTIKDYSNININFMYRTTEIVHILYNFNLSDDIIKKILSFEKESIYNDSLLFWKYISKNKFMIYKNSLINYNRNLHLKEIIDINGKIEYLKKNKYKFWNITPRKYNYSYYLNSFK